MAMPQDEHHTRQQVDATGAGGQGQQQRPQVEELPGAGIVPGQENRRTQGAEIGEYPAAGGRVRQAAEGGDLPAVESRQADHRIFRRMEQRLAAELATNERPLHPDIQAMGQQQPGCHRQ